jgi:hypothetical protein
MGKNDSIPLHYGHVEHSSPPIRIGASRFHLPTATPSTVGAIPGRSSPHLHRQRLTAALPYPRWCFRPLPHPRWCASLSWHSSLAFPTRSEISASRAPRSLHALLYGFFPVGSLASSPLAPVGSELKRELLLGRGPRGCHEQGHARPPVGSRWRTRGGE